MKIPVVVLLLLLTVALAGCSDAAIDHKNAGIKLSNDGRWEQAIAEYNEALRLDPQHARAYNKRGIAYDGPGEHQRAIEDYNEAIRLDPQDAQAYAVRALSNTYLDRDLEAQQDTERVTELGFNRVLLESAIKEARRQR